MLNVPMSRLPSPASCNRSKSISNARIQCNMGILGKIHSSQSQSPSPYCVMDGLVALASSCGVFAWFGNFFSSLVGFSPIEIYTRIYRATDQTGQPLTPKPNLEILLPF